jgi:hypothetical protein
MKMIPCVQASDMPEEVLMYCIDNEISTHYQNDITVVHDDDSPFAVWLRESGYKFTDKYGDYIGIIAT